MITPFFACIVLTRILTVLEEIKVQNRLVISNQLRHLLQSESIPVPTALPPGFSLPLQSLEQLLHLNACCLDADVQRNVVY